MFMFSLVLLQIMGDYPMKEKMENSLLLRLVNVALKFPSLSDEIFCQLCKQLTANPTLPSEVKGWWVLGVFIQYSPPSTSLWPFLYKWLQARIEAPSSLLSEEKLRTWSQAVNSMQRFGTRLCDLTGGELELLLVEFLAIFHPQSDEIVTTAITMPDKSKKRIQVTPYTTCSESVSQLCSKLDLVDPSLYALFIASADGTTVNATMNGQKMVLPDLYILDVVYGESTVHSLRDANKRRRRLSRAGSSAAKLSSSSHPRCITMRKVLWKPNETLFSMHCVNIVYTQVISHLLPLRCHLFCHLVPFTRSDINCPLPLPPLVCMSRHAKTTLTR